MTTPILFFGDGSVSLHPNFAQILHAKRSGTLLAQFLNGSRSALQDEIQRLSATERMSIPDVTELENLIPKPGVAEPDNQCLAPSMLTIIQVGQFISWYEARPHEPYPDVTSGIVLGLCVGQIAASAVSLAKSLTELVPLAVEAVRLAFRTGTAAVRAKNELQAQVVDKQSWALGISRASGLSDADNLAKINAHLGLEGRKVCYISAILPKFLTIQGPPSSLDTLEGYLAQNCADAKKGLGKRLPIYTPYHAQHLYSEKIINEILYDSEKLALTADGTLDASQKVLSPLTGQLYSFSSRYSLLRQIFQDVLMHPIDWAKVTTGCVDFVNSCEFREWRLQPFGPTTAVQGLVSLLSTQAGIQVHFSGASETNDLVEPTSHKQEPIAIVGMAGRFPEAMNHDELWRVLEQGMDCHKVVPGDRFSAAQYSTQSGAKNPIDNPHGCFLENPGLFDAKFFHLSPRETEQTDPQQRLALTTAYEALEMSGFVPNRTPSTRLERVGTYYGQTADDYREANASQDVQTYYISGNDRAFGSGRINHFFKFGGPSMSIDTACSSSAVALNVACTALWAAECDTALVGGVNLLTNPDTFSGLSQGHFLNKTGNCKTYDNEADGYCRGEAVATVVIKRLSDAQRDNDNILAMILAVGTNYSAESTSITHPHGPTQEKLYRRLLAQAALQPFDVDYVEMHGTGTQAGDAVEMSSVSNVFAPAEPSRPKDLPLWVGSVKSNIGHGESASGVTALIKALLVLRQQRIPKHVGIKSGTINRTFPDLEERRIRIALDGAQDFPVTKKRIRRALVNNFGAAGGNTAILLQAAPTEVSTGISDPRSSHVISLTGKTQTSLLRNIQNLLRYLDQTPLVSLSDLSYTLTARRMQHPKRVSIVASSIPELKDRLISATVMERPSASSLSDGVAFVFTGQGSLYLSLAKELFETSLCFRNSILRCNEICVELGLQSFIPIVDGSATKLDTQGPVQTQLAITSVQMSLYRLWTAWDITPKAILGHSLGEYAALFACGALSAVDTLGLVGHRAVLLEKHCTSKTHCMLAVQLALERLDAVLGQTGNDLEVACVNGPTDIVLSESADKIAAAKANLQALDIRCTVLETPFAFHSNQVQPILEPFLRTLQKVKFSDPVVPLLSPLLGRVVRNKSDLEASYLARHARETVNFRAALDAAKSNCVITDQTTWLEIGPAPVCSRMIQASLGSHIVTLPTLSARESPWFTTTKSLCSLHDRGHKIRWDEYHREYEGTKTLLQLPSYAFEEQKYWIDHKNDWLRRSDAPGSRASPASEAQPFITSSVHRLISKTRNDKTWIMVFETDLSKPEIHAVIAGHILNGSALVPAGVYADMALTIGDYLRKEILQANTDTGISVEDMQILGPITVPVPRTDTAQQLRITAEASLETRNITLAFSSGLNGTTTARCRIGYESETAWLRSWRRTKYLVERRVVDLERDVTLGHADKLNKHTIYRLFSAVVDYAPKYQGLQEVLVNTEQLEAIATVKVFDEGSASSNFFYSPLWIDNMAQLAGFVMNGMGIVNPSVAVFIAQGWTAFQATKPVIGAGSYRIHVKLTHIDDTTVLGDVSIIQNGAMVGLISEVRFHRMFKAMFDRMLASPFGQSKQQVAPVPRALPRSDVAVKAMTLATTLEQQVKHPPPSESPVTQIMQIIAEEIGVSRQELKPSSDFNELGVDSLLSLTIHSRIKEELQVELSADIFQTCASIGDLLDVLHSRVFKSSDAGSNETLKTTDDGQSTPDSSSEPDMISHDDVLSSVQQLVAAEIGVSVQELLATDDLSSLGVDSLMSLTIIGTLQEKLGVVIPPEVMHEGLTMEGLAGCLGVAASPPPPVEHVAPQSTTHAAHFGRSDVVLLQGSPSTARQTLFLFPDGSGSATSYLGLPGISHDVCVFAINSPFLKDPLKYTCGLEEATRIMVNGLRQRQPKGPYLLAGWSAGGMYAFEAARMLSQAGELVQKLILIDSPCRLDFGPMPRDVLDFVSRSGVIAGKGDGMAPQWLVTHFESTIKAVKTYAPKPLRLSEATQVHLLWARKGVFEDWPDGELARIDLTDAVAAWLLKPKEDPGPQGWDKLCEGGQMRCATVEGNHFSMVHPPHCTSLSREIAVALNSADQ